VRWCPRNECSGYVRGQTLDDKKVDCPDCGQAICFRCRDEWHGRCTSCEKALERKFEGWADGNGNISFCPMCRTKVEKIDGCNHMTCLFCKYQWCWVCKDTFTGYDHYTAGNPFGCGVGTFDTEVPNWCCRQLKKLLFILLGLILLPFVLVFAFPCIITAGWISLTMKLDVAMCCCCCFVGTFIVFAIGLALDVIVIPLAIIAGILGLIVLCVTKVKQSRQ